MVEKQKGMKEKYKKGNCLEEKQEAAELVTDGNCCDTFFSNTNTQTHNNTQSHTITHKHTQPHKITHNYTHTAIPPPTLKMARKESFWGL